MFYEIILDAQLSPALALYIKEELGIEARSVRSLGLLKAKDAEIFEEARKFRRIIGRN
jgi:predicted nuclease of predicted toxin-antitoxin system